MGLAAKVLSVRCFAIRFDSEPFAIALSPMSITHFRGELAVDLCQPAENAFQEPSNIKRP